MGWLKGNLGARWFLPVLIGLTAVVTIVFGWGYLKGYNSAEVKYTQAMNKALTEQLARLTTIHTKDLATATKKQEVVNNVKWRIRDVFRPDCSISPECLRAFNDGVRASGTNTDGVDSDSRTD